MQTGSLQEPTCTVAGSQGLEASLVPLRARFHKLGGPFTGVKGPLNGFGVSFWVDIRQV